VFDEQGDRLDLAGDWLGFVTDNNDPLGLGRVRARVPGLLEPTSPWLEPKLPGIGSGVGLWAVPPRGARVVVTLNAGGRSTERGFYAPVGPSRAEDLPDEIVDDDGRGSVDAIAMFSDRYVVILDDRSDRRSAAILDRQRGDVLRLDGTDISIQISSTTGLDITSQGEININAPLVRIQGRPVLPSGTEPI
jgi:hypothetical protein